MKVILNKCYGGFSLSHEAYMLYAKKKGITLYPYAIDYATDTYYLTNNPENEYTVHYFTKNYGDTISFKDAKDEYFLWLNYSYREDPILVEVVEELRSKANGRFADLKVVDIPDNMDYVIDNYDGIETLHPKVQEW